MIEINDKIHCIITGGMPEFPCWGVFSPDSQEPGNWVKEDLLLFTQEKFVVDGDDFIETWVTPLFGRDKPYKINSRDEYYFFPKGSNFTIFN